MKIHSVFAMTAAIAIFGINPMLAMSQSQTGCDVKLRSSSPGARINVRSGPGTQYSSPHYGVAGDRVVVLRGNSVDGNVDGFAIASDRQGYQWVKVKFSKSGAQGWIRRDLLGNFRC